MGCELPLEVLMNNKTLHIIRLLDIFLSFIAVLIFIPFGFLLFMGGLFDTGSPIFMQKRVGRDRRPFYIIKFRTMAIDTKETATHLVGRSSVTKYGSFLRRTKLDELPQMINVLKGEMSLVGARPNLLNQTELIHERERRGVYNYRPGITGLSQICGIDMSNPSVLAETDAEMYKNLSVFKYFSYILFTLLGQGQGDRIERKFN